MDTVSDRKKDLFYKEVEGRMESLKRRPAEKEKTTRSEKINVIFNVVIGLVILLGVPHYAATASTTVLVNRCNQ